MKLSKFKCMEPIPAAGNGPCDRLLQEIDDVNGTPHLYCPTHGIDMKQTKNLLEQAECKQITLTND